MSQLQIYLRCMQSVVFYLLASYLDLEFSHFKYLLDHQMMHPTERYYLLRPELAESTFYLYQATKCFCLYF
ncbi:hypothetical protein YC2023_096433 [Brassica napus]